MRRGTGFLLGALLGGGVVAMALAMAARPPKPTQPAARDAAPAASVKRPKIAFGPPIEHPNFLVILADDYGQDQVGAYKVHPRPPPSPRIDALATQGVMFRNAFANPMCSPTRATLMTGRYAYRYGIGNPIPPKKGWALPETERLVPAALREAAQYHSAVVGKWHLSSPDMGGLDHARRMGFDHHFGTMGNILGNVYGTDQPQTFYHWSKVEDGEVVESHDYLPSVTIDDAVRFTRELPEPWFLYVPLNLVHYPQHLPPAELVHRPIPPNPTETELFRAMAEAMDTEVGRLIDSIDPAVLSRTEILFLGDNGTAPVGVTEPFVKQAAKGALTRGGVAVPFIWLGPSVTQPGSETSAVVNTTDLFATLLELAHIDAPPPADSVSFAAQLRDPAAPGARRYAYTERFGPNGMGPYEEYSANVRDERYSLVVIDGKSDQLYDASGDLQEQHNLLKLSNPSDELMAVFKRLKYALPDAIPVEQRPTAEELAAAGIDVSGKLR